jgi:hypothetical protein
MRQSVSKNSGDETMNGDNPLWYDCDEEARQERTGSRTAHVARVLLVLALLAAAYLAGQFLL